VKALPDLRTGGVRVPGVARAATAGAPQIPFADPGLVARVELGELTEALERVVRRGRFLLADEVDAFEREFAANCGLAHAVGVASGTDAIELAVRALGIGPGDEVITQANTCVPTIAAIVRAGAVPVLCDVDATGAMDVASAAAAISDATRALLPVHLYGNCADMVALCTLAAERDLHVIEDCAHALGAALHGRPAGSFGALACFSFYPTKQLGALGDAGAVASTDAALAERVRALRSYGERNPGINSRMDELQAAFMRGRLAHLGGDADRREALALRYDEAFADGPACPLARHPGRRHAMHLYVVEVADRDEFRERLARAGIATGVHYSPALHRDPVWGALARTPVALPVAERLADRVVSLPLFPMLRDDEQAAVIEATLGAAHRAGPSAVSLRSAV
jgi:dTDP-3-amino-3,4,6-trideoxy-alpha-D-glucose transaminase